MKDLNKSDMLNWIHQWENTGKIMERSRRTRLLNVNVQQAIENLDDAFESALLNSSIKLTSGLVEMQNWFTRTSP
ncbi:MAG: hypothetical protein V3U02_13530 [Calditrichia bacterium]